MPTRKPGGKRGKRPPKAPAADEEARQPSTDTSTPQPSSHLNQAQNSSAPGLRGSDLIHLQRQIGNRRAQELVPSSDPSAGKVSVLQRDPLNEPLSDVGAPLVGLKRGDGLDFGTADKRERVTLLQIKLNEKMVANIKEDGMFGPRTEEVLGEFQESVDLPSSSVVDSVTADLLMSEGEPEPTPGPEGEVPHPNLVSSGASLTNASTNVFAGSLFLVACGSLLSNPLQNDPAREGAGSLLSAADGALSKVSAALVAAGSDLAQGDEAGIQSAGAQLVAAGRDMQLASLHISIAGQLLSQGNGIGDRAAGNLLAIFSKRLGESGLKVEQAGFKLQEHKDRRKPIGDPIVGLKKGDGLIFGTFNRRDRVQILQDKLNNKIGAGLVIDGMFGERTTAALQELQASEGLPQSERVDSATAKSLRDAPETERGETPLALAGESLSRAGEILSLGSIFLNASGNALMAGFSPENFDLEAGQQLINASEQFNSAGSAFSSAGSDLQDI